MNRKPFSQYVAFALISSLFLNSCRYIVPEDKFSILETIPIPADTKVLAIGDMDGDKILDIVVAHDSTATISILERTDTDFSVRHTIRESVVRTGCCNLRGPSVSDIDNDGLPEIVSGNFNGRLQIWESTGNDTYEAIYTEQIGNFIEVSIAADYDGDGQDELLVSRETFPSRVFIVKVNNNSYQIIGNLTGDGGNANVVGSLDLDDDGIPETVFHDDSYSRNKKIYVYEEQKLVFSEGRQSSRSLGDTDGNGLGEIIGIENSTGNLRIIESAGQNNLFIEVYNAPGKGYRPYVIDMDNDGLMEFWRVKSDEFHNANILEFAMRVEDKLLTVYSNEELFRGFDGNITDIFAINDIDYDGTNEMAVIQGTNIHILHQP